MNIENITVNAKIRECGLFYLTHYKTWEARAILELPGGGCILTIPENKFGEFVKLFQDDMNIEDGVFFHNFEGRYIRVTFENGKAVAIYDLLDRECVVLDDKE